MVGHLGRGKEQGILLNVHHLIGVLNPAAPPVQANLIIRPLVVGYRRLFPPLQPLKQVGYVKNIKMPDFPLNIRREQRAEFGINGRSDLRVEISEGGSFHTGWR